MQKYSQLLERLISERKARKIQQKDIAVMLNTVPATVSNWEHLRARIPWDHALTLLHHYGLSLEIVGRKNARAVKASDMVSQIDDDALAAVVMDILGHCVNLDESTLLDIEAIAARFATMETRHETKSDLK